MNVLELLLLDKLEHALEKQLTDQDLINYLAVILN